jgi:hypothetical protein
VLAGVVLGLAGSLRVLDAVPSWLRGEPRTTRDYATIEALERETRTQLVLPFYFPDTLAWPPVRVVRAAGDGRPTSVVIADRWSGTPRLIVAQCLDGDCALEARLLPGGRETSRERIPMSSGAATLVRRTVPGTGPATDLEWHQFDRRLIIRLHGDERELLRIARSMRRGHP